jgi:hypothetical protein
MDPMEGYSRWHRWAVSGTEETISKSLHALDTNLTGGWKEGYSRWHRWAVSGTEETISKSLHALDTNLTGGWKRLAGSDLLSFQPLDTPGAAWYGLPATPCHPEVTLSLERLGGTRLRGGWVSIGKPPGSLSPSNTACAWEQVMRFWVEMIVPAARAAGADVRMPTPQEVFLAELPVVVRDRLRAFSTTARKSLPMDRQEAALWHEFVIAAYRAEVVIDARQFTDWLVAEGWPAECAVELNLRFFDQCMLLSRYAEEVPAA